MPHDVHVKCISKEKENFSRKKGFNGKPRLPSKEEKNAIR
jgi:hypothetical protein